MSSPKLYHHAHNTWHGISAFIIKILTGLLLSSLFLVINRVTEYFFGKEAISYLAIILITVIFSIYMVIRHFTRANFFYLIGWIVGLLALYRLELSFLEFDVIHLSIYIGIPTIMFVVRFIMYLYSDREEF